MELELKKTGQVFYDMTARSTVIHEQTCEVIVSDSQPDILRIAGANGCAMCNAPRADTRGALLGGSVHAAVLYLPEDGGDVCCIPVKMEFSYPIELAQSPRDGEGAGSVLHGGAELVSIEAKVLNPRKVLVRAELKLWAARAERVEFELCTDAAASPELAVELLRESYTARLLCSAGRRAFAVEDTFDLPASRPAAAELLYTGVSVEAGDYNVIGRRVIFRGTLHLSLTYRTTGGEIAGYSTSAQFSQVAELDDLEDGAECVVRLSPSEFEASLVQNGEGRTVEFTAGVEAQLEAYAERRLEAITDLYSTSMRAAVDVRPCTFTTLYGRSVLRAQARCSAETARQVLETRGCEAGLRQMRLSRGDSGELMLSGEAEARLGYIDDAGELCQLRCRVPAEVDAGGLEVDFDRGDSLLVDAHAENFAASPSAGTGAELRFDVVCEVTHLRPLVIGAVAGAQLEPEPEDAPARPSVVLRVPERGETLWQTAKRYCATVAEIAAANSLEDADPLAGAPENRMLLIPRRR